MDPNPYSHTALKPSDAAAAADGRVPSPHSFALSGKIMLSAIVILFSIVLFILFLHFYVRWHVLRRARSRRRRFVFSGGDHSSSPNRAIDPSILKSLPVLLFSPASADDAELDECDCAVCLNEFEDGEKIRHLPLCGHSFHVDCIDMWFASHSNCPLCRAAVEAAPPSRQEVTGSSSSDSGEGEVTIDVPEAGVEGFSEETEALGLGQVLKWPINRVVLFRRFLTLDLGPDRNGVSGAAADLESGEGTPPPAPAV